MFGRLLASFNHRNQPQRSTEQRVRLRRRERPKAVAAGHFDFLDIRLRTKMGHFLVRLLFEIIVDAAMRLHSPPREEIFPRKQRSKSSDRAPSWQ